MKFGLEGISRLLKELKDPQKEFPSVHIAGTNGKGSTASMLAAMLTAAGYKTGLYTSPHLVKFEERIRIDGKAIPRASLSRLTTFLKRSILRHHPTFFEATTAIAFAHFAQREVDVAVIETGLGGRLDSTNVLRPVCSVITNIGLEHTEILGDTLEKIALEKAGIVKKDTPCVTGIREPRALAVLKRACRQNHAPLFLGTGYRARVREATLEGTLVDFTLGKNKYKNLRVSLPGQYQLGNLGVALRAVQVLNDSGSFRIDEAALRNGLASRLSDQVVAVAAHTPRSRSASDIAAAFEREKCRTRAALSVEGGIRLAMELAGPNGTILVTGSHFVVGEAVAALGLKRA
ncbi:MAG: Mur ligase family protein [Ignavibacteriales bacterium]|nr:Mur ligase family protein [Ignavibacteriales bacterium]